jgi:hypothetical protein
MLPDMKSVKLNRHEKLRWLPRVISHRDLLVDEDSERMIFWGGPARNAQSARVVITVDFVREIANRAFVRATCHVNNFGVD